jgi:predicted TIM-barrel fold metal-dependent hydrolase
MIIDFHTHIFPPWLRDQREKYIERDATLGELYASPEAKMATADDLVAAMDEDGVDVSVVMGVGWTDFGLAREANDYIIESVARYPDRLTGFAGVSPAWGDAAGREAERCAGAGLRGVGEMHPDTQAFDLGDERTMAPLMEVARERGLVVTTHSSEPVGHSYPGKGTTRPDVLWRFIRSFPDVTVVCAHWGGGLPFYALMPEVAEGLSNVYFDTAASPFLYNARVFSVAASLVGADRVLLGSDYPLLRASRLLKQVDESALSESEREAVTGGNAARLLRV